MFSFEAVLLPCHGPRRLLLVPAFLMGCLLGLFAIAHVNQPQLEMNLQQWSTMTGQPSNIFRIRHQRPTSIAHAVWSTAAQGRGAMHARSLDYFVGVDGEVLLQGHSYQPMIMAASENIFHSHVDRKGPLFGWTFSFLATAIAIGGMMSSFLRKTQHQPFQMNMLSITGPGEETLAVGYEGPYSAVAVDLDGTLLNDDHVISERTREVLRQLSQQGLKVILATGRSLPACYAHVEALALPTPLPVVCYNGACGVVFHPDSKASPQELFQESVPRPQRERLLRLAEEQGVVVQYYHGDQIYVNCRTDTHRELTRKYAQLAGVGHTQIESYDDVLHLDPCKMLIMTDDPDTIVEAGQRCFADGSLTVVRGSPPFFVEFLPPMVYKGIGLARMCKVLGQPLERIIAFGDGDNDIEMLQMVGKGFAMCNARGEVRARAPNVTELSNEVDGVVEELLQLQRHGLLCFPLKEDQVAMFASGGQKDEEPSADNPQGTGLPVDNIGSAVMPQRFIESPFTVGKVVTTMILWAAALAVTGIVVLPLLCALLGIPLLTLEPLQKVEYFVVLQIVETLVAYSVFNWALSPYQPLPDGWFQYNHNGPFGRRGWLTWAGIGVLLAPFAVATGSVLNEILGQTGMSATVAEVSDIVEGSGQNSPVVLVLLSAITSILAPLMEEGVFRGFLLTALTKWMPVPSAVLLSSACFALAHLSAHDFAPLFLLGNVLGLVYVQSKDLLAPTIVHCLWNLFVLILLAAETF